MKNTAHLELQRLMTKYDISQRGLANKTGVHFVTINRIITGKTPMSRAVAKRLLVKIPCSFQERQRVLLKLGDDAAILEGYNTLLLDQLDATTQVLRKTISPDLSSETHRKMIVGQNERLLMKVSK